LRLRQGRVGKKKDNKDEDNGKTDKREEEPGGKSRKTVTICRSRGKKSVSMTFATRSNQS
jgi:hypothetical protein